LIQEKQAEMISPGKGFSRVSVRRFVGDNLMSRKDVVAVEEPLEIRIEYTADGVLKRAPISITMRTPGEDFELAVGFLYSEGIIQGREDVRQVSYCQGDEPQTYNIVLIKLAETVVFDFEGLARNFYTTSSCGVCGKASLEAIDLKGYEKITDMDFKVSPAVIKRLPDTLRERQGLFERTGGIHAAGLFSQSGECFSIQEDVGRHNAVDKVVGQAFLKSLIPLDRHILIVSGRTSFEIMQKALAARLSVVVAVGAPSSLAVDLAEKFGITLLGFTKVDGFNVYAGSERIIE